MEDLVNAVLWTAALPGMVVGLLLSFRSGILITLLGIIVGGIGGLVGGLTLPGVLNASNIEIPAELAGGPAVVIGGAVIGALILMLLTSGLRTPASD
ncbi:MAG: hypothetical protein NW216_13935 [Hyphomicrobium sp.]|nr:hypothetical protein [Hyphomicrobium sp.]